MLGWNRKSFKNPIIAREFWIRYGIRLAQVLVIVAYFLPWNSEHAGLADEGLLAWIYSEFMHDPSASTTFLLVSLLFCFASALISLVLAVVALARKGENGRLIIASSLLNAIAIAGPLVFIHGFLSTSGSDWTRLVQAIGEMGIGWFIALLVGSIIGFLMLYECHPVSKCDEGIYDVRRRSPDHPYVISFFIMPVMMIMAIIGFCLPWTSGFARSLWAQTSWSTSGFEVSPLMYLVPAVAVLFCTLFMNGNIVRDVRGSVLSHAVQNLLIVTFAMTLSWGLAFGEFEIHIPDTYMNAKLQLGWYLCMISLSLMLVCALCPKRHRSQSTGVSSELAREVRS